MNKKNINDDNIDVLELKTGFGLYRVILLFLFCIHKVPIIFSILPEKFALEVDNAPQLLIVSGCTLLAMIFIEEFVTFLRLPTYKLIVTKDEIKYKKRKKCYVFKIKESHISYSRFLHEDFDMPSIFHIYSLEDSKLDFMITLLPKHFKMMQSFLKQYGVEI